MRESLVVAGLFFLTSIDSILLIFSAIHMKRHPYPKKARFIILLTLVAAHPLYSFAADTFFRLPGLRIVSAVFIIYFALRMAGEPPVEFRSGIDLPKHTTIAIVGTTVWLDAMTSIDTSILVSAASPSFLITFIGNTLAMLLLIALAPALYRLALEKPGLKIGVAGFMALSAVLQLEDEVLLDRHATSGMLIPAALLALALTALYGWKKHYR